MPDHGNCRIIDDLPGQKPVAGTNGLSEGTLVISENVNKVLRIIVLFSGILSLLIGIITLAGYVFGSDIFRQLDPSFNSMRANTTVCIIFLGCSLILKEMFLENRSAMLVSRILILIVSAVCILSIFEYLAKVNLGIDQLIFKDLNGSIIYPGRLAFNTCICFLLLGIALFFVDTDSNPLLYLSQILPLATGILCILPILGYLYGANELLSVAFSNHMSIYSAVCILILSLGIICLPHSAGFLSILTANGPGGYMARRLLPLTVFIPVVFVWVRLLTNTEESRSGSVDVIIISFLYIGIFAFFIWKIARAINSIDQDRIVAQKALKQSEQKFHTAFYSSPASLIITSLSDGTIIDLNESYCQMIGMTAQQLIGRKTIELNLWENSEGRNKMLAEMAANGPILNLEIRLRKGSGEIRTALASFEKIDLYGEPCVISSAIDITDLKLTQKYNILANEILEHINRYNEMEPMISAIIDSIKEKTGYEAIAIRINEGEDFPYFKTVGFDDEFVKSERYLCTRDKNGQIIRDENNDARLDCMCGNIIHGRVDTTKSFFTQGGSFRSNNTTSLLTTTTVEERLARTRNRCNGAGFESVALVPLRSGKKIIGLLQINDHRKDVFDANIIQFLEQIGSSIGVAIMRNKAESEIKSLNIQLENRVAERTEQLLDSNKELESFAYSVSHDLRAPLRHVIGFSEILEEELGKGKDANIDSLTGKIKSAASKMGRLIDELLDYSRLGRSDLKTEMISLNPIIEDVINEAADITKERKITWHIKCLPEVRADKTLIRLVLQNLINNSVKFTAKKDSAVIEIGTLQTDNNEHLFFIKDNGAGFDMEFSGKLFGVFQRLHTSLEFEGTGIGLATVRRILKRLGGKVWADAKEDAGATFYFTLPK